MEYNKTHNLTKVWTNIPFRYSKMWGWAAAALERTAAIMMKTLHVHGPVTIQANLVRRASN